MNNDWQRMVREFHEKFGQPIGDKPQRLTEQRWLLRRGWEASERDEGAEAHFDEDLPGEADAIVDEMIFLIGRAIEMGIDLDPLFRCVMAANMTKIKIPGQEKIGKPPGFVHPDIAGELAKQGWKL